MAVHAHPGSSSKIIFLGYLGVIHMLKYLLIFQLLNIKSFLSGKTEWGMLPVYLPSQKGYLCSTSCSNLQPPPGTILINTHNLANYGSYTLSEHYLPVLRNLKELLMHLRDYWLWIEVETRVRTLALNHRFLLAHFAQNDSTLEGKWNRI